MKKLLAFALVLMLALSVCALVACGPQTYAGEYSEPFGKNQDIYTTKVVVTVKGDTIVSVEMAEDSNHYTVGSGKWDSTKWTNVEANILAAFEGQSVSAILAATENTVFTTEAVAGATVTGNRIYQAVLNALQSIEA